MAACLSRFTLTAAPRAVASARSTRVRVAAIPAPKQALPASFGSTSSAFLGSGKRSLQSEQLAARRSIACAAAAQEEMGMSGPDVDFEAIARYFAVTALELGLMVGFMFGVQSFLLPNVSADIGKGIVFGMYLYLSVGSRIFNVLGAKRPSVKDEDKAKNENRRPSWMPPPKAFPVVWFSIAFLRAISSVIVWEASGRDLLAAPLIAFLLHLSIGDTWNHITNVKKQLGVSFSGTAFVWGSVVSVTALYYGVSEQAGLVLAPSVVWLTIASYLVYCIWQLNEPEKHPLLPRK